MKSDLVCVSSLSILQTATKMYLHSNLKPCPQIPWPRTEQDWLKILAKFEDA